MEGIQKKERSTGHQVHLHQDLPLRLQMGQVTVLDHLGLIAETDEGEEIRKNMIREEAGKIGQERMILDQIKRKISLLILTVMTTG